MDKLQQCKEAYQFLAELITKMNNQSNARTATPYYYTIRTMKKEWGIDSGFADDYEWTKDGERFGDNSEFAEYIREQIIEELGYGGDGFISFALSEEIDPDNIDSDEYEFECLLNALDMNDHINGFDKVYWRETEEFKGVFLTKEACEEHLNKNRHHYSKDSHSYVMHFFRNSEMKKLFESIGEIVGVQYQRK
jgi:hypothetical protein